MVHSIVPLRFIQNVAFLRKLMCYIILENDMHNMYGLFNSI